jgi:hypothetical protein
MRPTSRPSSTSGAVADHRQVITQRDTDPSQREALANGGRQARPQLGGLEGVAQDRAELGQQLVALHPLAEHPPVGHTLEPTPRRLHHNRDQDGEQDGHSRRQALTGRYP